MLILSVKKPVCFLPIVVLDSIVYTVCFVCFTSLVSLADLYTKVNPFLGVYNFCNQMFWVVRFSYVT